MFHHLVWAKVLRNFIINLLFSSTVPHVWILLHRKKKQKVFYSCLALLKKHLILEAWKKLLVKIQWNFLTAMQLVYLRPCPAARNIAMAYTKSRFFMGRALCQHFQKVCTAKTICLVSLYTRMTKQGTGLTLTVEGQIKQ